MTFARIHGIDWVSGQDTSPFTSCAIVKFSILETDVPPITASVTLQALKHSFRRYGFQRAGCCDEPAEREIFEGGIHNLLSCGYSIKPSRADLTALIVYLAPSGVVSKA